MERKDELMAVFNPQFREMPQEYESTREMLADSSLNDVSEMYGLGQDTNVILDRAFTTDKGNFDFENYIKDITKIGIVAAAFPPDDWTLKTQHAFVQRVSNSVEQIEIMPSFYDDVEQEVKEIESVSDDINRFKQVHSDYNIAAEMAIGEKYGLGYGARRLVELSSDSVYDYHDFTKATEADMEKAFHLENTEVNIANNALKDALFETKLISDYGDTLLDQSDVNSMVYDMTNSIQEDIEPTHLSLDPTIVKDFKDFKAGVDISRGRYEFETMPDINNTVIEFDQFRNDQLKASIDGANFSDPSGQIAAKYKDTIVIPTINSAIENKKFSLPQMVAADLLINGDQISGGLETMSLSRMNQIKGGQEYTEYLREVVELDVAPGVERTRESRDNAIIKGMNSMGILAKDSQYIEDRDFTKLNNMCVENLYGHAVGLDQSYDFSDDVYEAIAKYERNLYDRAERNGLVNDGKLPYALPSEAFSGYQGDKLRDKKQELAKSVGVVIEKPDIDKYDSFAESKKKSNDFELEM